ncbi:MAG: hypothetical protein U0234_03610 [Sandaracinus sp.]
MRPEEVPVERLDPRFAPHLREHEVDHLEHSLWPVYAMWPTSALAYFNPAYARQAEPRWGLGALALDAAGVVRPKLVELHEEVIATGGPVTFRYECPTAESARTFELRLLPLDGGRGLLALHSLVVARPHEDPHFPDPAVYLTPQGMILQCAYCRRTRRAGGIDVWDVVGDYIARSPSNATHGICPPCGAHYYPALRE